MQTVMAKEQPFAPDLVEFKKMWLDESITAIEVAIHYGEQMTVLRCFAEKMKFGAKRERLDGARRNYLPTPEDIDRECKRIQQTWPAERFGIREQ